VSLAAAAPSWQRGWITGQTPVPLAAVTPLSTERRPSAQDQPHRRTRSIWLIQHKQRKPPAARVVRRCDDRRWSVRRPRCAQEGTCTRAPTGSVRPRYRFARQLHFAKCPGVVSPLG
jgi:hypothetical protein